MYNTDSNVRPFFICNCIYFFYILEWGKKIFSLWRHGNQQEQVNGEVVEIKKKKGKANQANRMEHDNNNNVYRRTTRSSGGIYLAQCKLFSTVILFLVSKEKIGGGQGRMKMHLHHPSIYPSVRPSTRKRRLSSSSIATTTTTTRKMKKRARVWIWTKLFSSFIKKKHIAI